MVMDMTAHRASFDATVTFTNGGHLTVDGFRVDIPSADATPAEIAHLFVASLSLLMVDEVAISNIAIIDEPHKGTWGGPSSGALPPVIPPPRTVSR